LPSHDKPFAEMLPTVSWENRFKKTVQKGGVSTFLSKTAFPRRLKKYQVRPSQAPSRMEGVKAQGFNGILSLIKATPVSTVADARMDGAGKYYRDRREGRGPDLPRHRRKEKTA